MPIKDKLKNFLDAVLFDNKWCCNVCGEEIFDGGYFCEECKKKLPFNNASVCRHCGRAVKVSVDYCSTCKGVLVSTDKSRSVFNYEPPVNSLIRKAKYDGKRYLLDIFGEYLAKEYSKNLFDAEMLCYVPMTKKSEKKRGYNQSELLARSLSEKTGLPVSDVLVKKKDTEHQAGLSRAERLTNLKDAFGIKNRSLVKGKKILIVDDVATTGATIEILASKLKKSGAAKVYALTVASVPPKDGY